MHQFTTYAVVAPPADGFSSYQAQVRNPPRPRWGDYGAAAVDGNSMWLASEYIAHTCDYTTWGGPFFAGGSGDNLIGTCAGPTRPKRSGCAGQLVRPGGLRPRVPIVRGPEPSVRRTDNSDDVAVLGETHAPADDGASAPMANEYALRANRLSG